MHYRDRASGSLAPQDQYLEVLRWHEVLLPHFELSCVSLLYALRAERVPCLTPRAADRCTRRHRTAACGTRTTANIPIVFSSGEVESGQVWPRRQRCRHQCSSCLSYRLLAAAGCIGVLAGKSRAFETDYCMKISEQYQCSFCIAPQRRRS